MKLINEKFDWSIGQTIITLADKYGSYVGTAKLAPDDVYSPIFGGDIAERRATIKKFKEDLKRARYKLKAIIDLRKDIQNICGDIDPKITRRFNLAIRNYNYDITWLKDMIEIEQTGIVKAIELRDKILNNKKVKN